MPAKPDDLNSLIHELRSHAERTHQDLANKISLVREECGELRVMMSPIADKITDHERRLRLLESWGWKLTGALLLIMAIVPLAVAMMKSL